MVENYSQNLESSSPNFPKTIPTRTSNGPRASGGGHLGGGYTHREHPGRDYPTPPTMPLASVFPPQAGLPFGVAPLGMVPNPKCRVVRSAQTEEEQDRRKQLDVLAWSQARGPYRRIGGLV